MLGIRSYKDLHYWESLWPNRNLGKHKMPIIDKMEDEHQDSNYTTYLQPEDIEIPEDFLSIPLSVR